MTKNVDIIKLNGGDNYHNWCFAVENALTYRGFENCIVEEEANRETDANKLKSARALLALSVEPALMYTFKTVKVHTKYGPRLKISSTIVD